MSDDIESLVAANAAEAPLPHIKDQAGSFLQQPLGSIDEVTPVEFMMAALCNYIPVANMPTRMVLIAEVPDANTNEGSIFTHMYNMADYNDLVDFLSELVNYKEE